MDDRIFFSSLLLSRRLLNTALLSQVCGFGEEEMELHISKNNSLVIQFTLRQVNHANLCIHSLQKQVSENDTINITCHCLVTSLKCQDVTIKNTFMTTNSTFLNVSHTLQVHSSNYIRSTHMHPVVANNCTSLRKWEGQIHMGSGPLQNIMQQLYLSKHLSGSFIYLAKLHQLDCAF